MEDIYELQMAITSGRLYKEWVIIKERCKLFVSGEIQMVKFYYMADKILG